MTTIGIFVHDIGSREVRVRFDVPVLEADSSSNYAISSVSGYVPGIVGVTYYDTDMLSVKITLDAALTKGETYSCQVLGLYSSDGSPVTSTPFNFVAADEDKPKILGAFLSKRGHIDVICDREVALFSTSATAYITATGEPSVAMVLVPWSSRQSLNAVRFSFSSAPSATSFRVQCFDIVDVSGNSCAHEEVPLTLAQKASGYSDLVQAQATFATVVDISNSTNFKTAVLRVFFNCPMLSADITNQSKWAMSQSGSHTAADTGNSITAANATSTPSFILLANDAKAMVNLHLVSHAHVERNFDLLVSTPDAVDYSTASNLTELVRAAYSQHRVRTYSHLYVDNLHSLDDTLSDSMDRINDLKSKFNDHILGSYNLDFSTAYSPIGPIMNFASTSNAGEVSDQFTWFADLHASSDTIEAEYTINFSSLRSEDMASSTSGFIVARPLFRPPTIMSISRSFRGVSIRMDCNVDIDPDQFSLIDVDNANSKIKARASLWSTLPVLTWAFNNVLHAYKMHISNPYEYPAVGAVHKSLDTVNTVSLSDYATSASLSSLISKANSFKSKINAHMTSETFHYGQDEDLDSPNAIDMQSLINLVLDLRSKLEQHNSSGISSRPTSSFPIVSTVPAFHSMPGIGIVSAIVHDLIIVTFDGAINGNTLRFSCPAMKTWKDNSLAPADRIFRGSVDGEFVAVDNIPALVSAIAKPGFSPVSPSKYLFPDMVELYLSKPMKNQLVEVGLNVVIYGAPITMTDAWWKDDRTIIVQIGSMSASAYSVEASDIRDVAGNLVYVPI